MKSKTSTYSTIILGVALLAAGLYLVKAGLVPRGAMRAAPYICIGLGCGLFGKGVGDAVSRRAMGSDPDFKKQLEIETNDERNIAIADKAKSRAFDIMTFAFGALLSSFGLMGIDMTVLLLIVFAYIFVHGLSVYYRFKLDKEM